MVEHFAGTRNAGGNLTISAGRPGAGFFGNEQVGLRASPGCAPDGNQWPDFDTVDPLSIKDLHKRAVKEERLQSTRSIVVTLFVLSILVGCLAPLMAVVTLAYVLTQRKTIARAGPVYLIMGYSAIGVSVLYSILMAAFWLFSR